MTGPALQTFTAGLAPEFASLVIPLDETIHAAQVNYPPRLSSAN